MLHEQGLDGACPKGGPCPTDGPCPRDALRLKDAPCLRADPLPRIKKDAQEGFGALKRNGCSMCKGCVIHAQGMVYG